MDLIWLSVISALKQPRGHYGSSCVYSIIFGTYVNLCVPQLPFFKPPAEGIGITDRHVRNNIGFRSKRAARAMLLLLRSLPSAEGTRCAFLRFIHIRLPNALCGYHDTIIVHAAAIPRNREYYKECSWLREISA